MGAEIDLAEALRQAAHEAGVPAERADNLRQLSGGASKEMWAFDLVTEDGASTPLVLRRQPPGRRFSSQ
jgi:hypothetical protein